MRDNFPQGTISALSRRAGQSCSNPSCRKSTSGPQPSNSSGVINIGVAAHITAASPKGKRYSASSTKQQRASIENGVWLCQDCGKLIDTDEEAYSVEVLRGWKELAERRALEAISGHQEQSIATLERRLAGHSNFVWDVAVTPDGRKVVSASNDKSIRVWDASTGVCLAILEGHAAFVCSVAISADGLQIASGDLDGAVLIWDMSTGDRQAAFSHGAADAKVAWRPDGRVIVTGGYDGTLAFWQVDKWSAVSRCKVHEGPILKISCMRDNRRVATVSVDKTVRIFATDSLECAQVFRGHAEEVNSVAVTPDEQFLVSASGDKTLRIWELSSGACHRVLYGHSEVVWRVAISPDGKILASGSGDNTVCLWSLESGDLLQTLMHPDCIAAVAFSPVGNRLVVGCDDAHVYLYRLSEVPGRRPDGRLHAGTGKKATA